MNLHVGSPRHPGGFRFQSGTTSRNGKPWRDHYFEHPIRWWFGISFARFFVGIVRTDPTITESQRTHPNRKP